MNALLNNNLFKVLSLLTIVLIAFSLIIPTSGYTESNIEERINKNDILETKKDSNNILRYIFIGITGLTSFITSVRFMMEFIELAKESPNPIDRRPVRRRMLFSGIMTIIFHSLIVMFLAK